MSDFVVENNILVKYTGMGGEVRVPDGVVSIANSVFKNHFGVKQVILPDTLEEMSGTMFHGCRRLERVKMPRCVESGFLKNS